MLFNVTIFKTVFIYLCHNNSTLAFPSWVRSPQQSSYDTQQCQRISASRFTTKNLQKWLDMTVIEHGTSTAGTLPKNQPKGDDTFWLYGYSNSNEEEFDWLTHYGCGCLQLISFIAILAIFSHGLGVRVISGGLFPTKTHHNLRNDVQLWDWGSTPIPPNPGPSKSSTSTDTDKRLNSSTTCQFKVDKESALRRKCVSAGPVLGKRIWCGFLINAFCMRTA